MSQLNSLSLFVGTGNCNAKCNHCAGIPLRKYSPKKDGTINEDLINKTNKTTLQKTCSKKEKSSN